MSEFTNAFEADAANEFEDIHAAELSNKRLRDLFYEWVNDETKESTARFYEKNFSPFYQEAEKSGNHLVTDATKNVVKTFLQNEADKLQPKTVGHRYSAISRFYSVLKEEYDLIDADESTPTEQLNRDNVTGMSKKTMRETSDGKDFHYLRADEVTQLIKNVPEPEPRNRALVMLMANTGLRASEIIRIRIDKLDLDRKTLKVKSPKLSEENDPEIISAHWRSDKVSDAIDAYLSFTRPSYFHSDSPYLFPSQQSERIGYTQVNRIIKNAAEEAGLQGKLGDDADGRERKNVTSHVLRHSYAMKCLDNGMNINEVKNALHHEKVETTMMYLREHKKETRKAIQNKGPTFG